MSRLSCAAPTQRTETKGRKQPARKRRTEIAKDIAAAVAGTQAQPSNPLQSDLDWSKVNDTTPRRVGDGVGAPNRIELVQKRGDVELGGVDGDAKPPGDHLV